MEVTGTLAVKGDTTKVSDKFTKRTFVLLVQDGKFPQHIELQLTQDKCGLIDNIGIGDTITAEFNLRGRSWLSPKGERHGRLLQRNLSTLASQQVKLLIQVHLTCL